MHDCCRGACAFEPPPRISAGALDAVYRVVREATKDGAETDPDIEIEIRTRVDRAFFVRATDMARACTRWDTGATGAEEEVITDVFHAGVRTRRWSGTGHVEHVRKCTLDSVDLRVHPGPREAPGFPAALRVSRARETPVALPAAACAEVTRVTRQWRRTFTTRGMRVDMSRVRAGTTYGEMEDAEPRYAIEIEVVDALGRCSAHLAASLLMKMLGFATCEETRVELPTST